MVNYHLIGRCLYGFDSADRSGRYHHLGDDVWFFLIAPLALP
ncbi:hypothetical protein [Psychrobacter sp. VH5]